MFGSFRVALEAMVWRVFGQLALSKGAPKFRWVALPRIPKAGAYLYGKP